MKHVRLVVFTALLGVVASAYGSGLPAFTIKAKQERIDRRESGSQRLPLGSTSLAVSDVCYVFTVTPTSLKAAPDVEAQWVILVESKDGRLSVASHGNQAVSFAGGTHGAEVRTPPIQLSDREWRGPWSSGAIKETIYGYAFRLVDKAGTLVAEKYEPAKMQQRVDWKNPTLAGDAWAPGERVDWKNPNQTGNARAPVERPARATAKAPATGRKLK